MPSRTELLNNLRAFSSDEIAEAIRAGVVSMYELSKSGNLTPLMRRRIEAKLSVSTSEIIISSHKKSTLSAENSSTTPVESDESLVIPETVNFETSSVAPLEATEMIVTTVPNTDIEPNTQSIGTGDRSNKGMFKRPFSFSGRIRRTEYGISFIIYLIWYLIINVMSNSSSVSLEAGIFALVSCIPMIWFLWAQNCKRCHDRGNSGWYQLIPFYFFVLLFGDGEKGRNEYGDSPKEL